MTEAKRHVLVKGGKVVDLVMPGLGYKPPQGTLMIESNTANIGDMYDGSKFTAFDRPVTREEMKDYLWQRRRNAVTGGIEVNLAEPGEKPNIVNIPSTSFYRDEIRVLAELAEVTGEDTILVIRDVGSKTDTVLTLTPKHLQKIRLRLCELVRHAHVVSAKILEGIDNARIPSLREIKAPETATAIKIPSWRLPNA